MDYGTALRLNPSGDIYLSDRMRFDVVSGSEKFAHDLIVLTRSIMGSYLFDMKWGVDYTTAISYSGNRNAVISWIVRAGLLKSKFVKSVGKVEVVINPTAREVTIKAEVTSKSDEDVVIEVTV